MVDVKVYYLAYINIKGKLLLAKFLNFWFLTTLEKKKCVGLDCEVLIDFVKVLSRIEQVIDLVENEIEELRWIDLLVWHQLLLFVKAHKMLDD